MTENEIALEIVDSCYHIHRELGPCLLESIYEEVLYDDLVQRGFSVTRVKKLYPLLSEARDTRKHFELI